MQSEAKAKALEQFTDYFVKNYPGPDTIIYDPNWHAPKIFAAAHHAITAALSDQERAVAVKAGELIERSHVIVEDVLDMALYLRDCPSERIGKYQDAANRLSAFMEEVRSALVDVPVEPVAWMHPTVGWTSARLENVRVHCRMDGPQPIPLYTLPPHREGEDSAEVTAAIRRAGTKARDELLERTADGGSVDNDLADYMTRIVDACERAALAATRSGSARAASGGDHGQ